MSETNWLEKMQAEVKKEKVTWKHTIETFDDLYNANLPDPEWFIHNILPRPGLVAITGKPGSYKTWFTQWMIQRLAHQKQLFDRYESDGCWFKQEPTRPVNVFFIEEEMSRRQISKRMKETKTFGECNNFFWNVSGGFNIQDPLVLQELIDFVREKKIDIIVFDPFTTCTKMKDENSNSEARIVMDLIRHNLVDSDLECTVVFIHHPSKGDESSANIRGAGDILGKCDMHFVVSIVDRRKDYAKIQIECGKSRYEPVDTFYAILQKDFQDTYQRLIWTFGGVKDEKEKSPEHDEDYIALKRYLDANPMSQQVVAAGALGMNPKGTKFRRIWKEITG